MNAYDYGVKLALEDLGLTKESAGFQSVEQMKNQAYAKHAPKAPPRPMPSPSRPTRAPAPPPAAQARAPAPKPAPTPAPSRGSMSMGSNVPQRAPGSGASPSLGSGMAESARQSILRRRNMQRRALNM